MIMARNRRVWVFVSSGSAPLDVAGPFDVLRRANTYSKTAQYDLVVVGASERRIRSESGLDLMAHGSLDEAMAEGLPHTIFVAGANPDVPPGSDEAKFALWLRENATHVPRICSICTGSFILAEAGLLDGRCATTHWSLLENLQQRFPRLRVQDDSLFVNEGGIWTSAGVTAGIDMTLALVEEDLGYDVALAVARFLVLFLRRSGGQQQYSATLEGQLTEHSQLKELQAYIVDHLDDDLTIERLARVCNMSSRNLSRVFKKELGMTLGRFVRKVRLGEARRLLESTDLVMAEIATRTGNDDESTLRRWFVDQFGVSPRQYRERFRKKET